MNRSRRLGLQRNTLFIALVASSFFRALCSKHSLVVYMAMSRAICSELIRDEQQAICLGGFPE